MVWRYAHLLLLHKLRVRAVVDDVLAENRGGQRGVDFLGVDILDLAIENEVVAFSVQTHSHLAAEEDEGEHIAVLRLVSMCPVFHGACYTPSSGWRRRTCMGRCRM
jgi:hypothetical protein